MIRPRTLVLFVLVPFLGMIAAEQEDTPTAHPQVLWSLELNAGEKKISVGPDGTLYVATSSGGSGAVLTALAPTGLVRWSWVANNARFANPPRFDRARNLLTVFDDRLVKLGPDGKLLWQRRFYLETEYGRIVRPAAVEVMAGGTSFVAGAYLNAFSAEGDLLWQFRGVKPMIAVHLLDGNVEASDGEKTYLITPAGKKIGQIDAGGVFFAPPQGGVDYRIERRHTQYGDSSRFVAQESNRWNNGYLWEGGVGSTSSVVADGPTLFLGGDHIAALDRQTGAVRWKVFTGGNMPVQTLPSGVIGGCDILRRLGSALCSYTREGKLRWAFAGTARPGFAEVSAVAVGKDETIYLVEGKKTLTALKDVDVH